MRVARGLVTLCALALVAGQDDPLPTGDCQLTGIETDIR